MNDLEVGGKRVVAVEVAYSKDKPHFADAAYIRSGSPIYSSPLLSRQQCGHNGRLGRYLNLINYPMPCITGIAFEDYVWSGFWAREFPGSQGWTRESQKALLDGRFRPDFAAWRGNERAIGDAKDKAILTYDDVDKAIEDAGAFRATYCYLMIASDTLVSDRVREYATEQRVEIVTMRGWRAR